MGVCAGGDPDVQVLVQALHKNRKNVCPRSIDHSNLLYKMGQDFLDRYIVLPVLYNRNFQIEAKYQCFFSLKFLKMVLKSQDDTSGADE